MFYSDALGFDRMVWEYPGALFLAAGGYHHHLGTNTWAGRGASSPSAEDAQLLEWNIELPGADAVSASAASLELAGYAVDWDDAQSQSGYVTHDPWGTPLHVRDLAR